MDKYIIKEDRYPNTFKCKITMTDKWGVNLVTKTKFIEKKIAN
jgi:hypothetical protein